jgi:myb proto-oncogene protein
MRSSCTKWTPEEDAHLAHLVSAHGDWGTIASHFPGRTNKQVLAHWKKVANPEIVRGSWTNDEDRAIIDWVGTNGPAKWSTLAEQLPGRIAKQCRERWCNHLNPGIKQGPWTLDEDEAIVTALQRLGPKWAEISRLVPGRTDNAVKNRWNSTLKKRTLDEIRARAGSQMESIRAMLTQQFGFAQDDDGDIPD